MVYHLYTVLYFITQVFFVCLFFKQVLFTREFSEAVSVHLYVIV